MCCYSSLDSRLAQLGRRSVAAASMLGLLTFSAAVPVFAQGDPEPPRVDRVGISTRPSSGDTFGPGETVTVQVRFSEPVLVTGNPRLVLQIGDQRRSADLQIVQRNRLLFYYFVRASDRDDDGIGIPASAILLNRGSIRDSEGNDADLTHAAVADDAALKVNGRLDAVPTIVFAGIVSRPLQGDTFGREEAIIAHLRFSEPVGVTGAPQLTIQVGTQARQVELHRRGGTSLLFEYVVQSSDVDADGVSMPANALALDGGSIRDADGNDADLTLDTVPDDPARKVNGASGGVPTVRRVRFSRFPASQDTYVAGETIFVNVAFTRDVQVTGEPRFTLQVGARERRAEHLPTFRAAELLLRGERGFHLPEDDGSLYFRYVVQPSDLDDDGVGAPANALTLDGGSIRAVGDDTDARLSHDALADDPGRKVDGSRGDDQAPTVVTFLIVDPPVRGTFGSGDTITVRLSLSEGVTVTGTPRVALRIGAQTRFATLRELYATTSMSFDYVVDESDRDDNGLSIDADAVDLNGGTIRDNAGNDANLDLGYFAFNDNPNYKVNGGLTPVPALPLGGVLALVVALLAGGWRRLAGQPACRR